MSTILRPWHLLVVAMALRWASQRGSIYVCDQKLPVQHRGPAGDVPLKTYEQLKQRSGFSEELLAQVLRGMSARRYEETVTEAGKALGVPPNSVSRLGSGEYVWPEGLAHYLRNHEVRLGVRVQHVLYLVNTIGGGYLFVRSIDAPTGEVHMPQLALAEYRKVLGADQTPELFVFDRGGWSQQNVVTLKTEGVIKVGIQPRLISGGNSSGCWPYSDSMC